MLVATPAPEDKIRELAGEIARSNSNISIESFLLPRDENCNFIWNTLCIRSIVPLFEWYMHEKDLHNETTTVQEMALSELLDGIINTVKHTVVLDGKTVPVDIRYLMNIDSWVSNFTAQSILLAFSRNLGNEFANIEHALSIKNPWSKALQFMLLSPTEAMGLVQKLAVLSGGPRSIYLNIPLEGAFFNRTTIYEIINDIRLTTNLRRIQFRRYPTNYFYIVSESVGYNRAIYSVIPELFSQHPLLRRIPGFNLGPADVQIEFLDGDYSGTWEITVDYHITPIDSIRNYFNVGELQDTVATLSAEVLELQRDRKALSEEAERLAGQLVEEEKARRIYQVRAAQADAVARFLHQTSNLVLQPLASTMIVFEDFIEIIEDCRSEWAHDKSEVELYKELDETLVRIQAVYPTAQQVINGYRELFHAFYEIYVSTKAERDVNQDLRYIETLVKNKYILTQVELELELDLAVPLLKLEGGVQSIFLELMHNAAKHGAKHILVKSDYDGDAGQVRLFFYNDGEPIPEEKWEIALKHEVTREGRGFGMADARYIIEILNHGWLRLIPSDSNRFSVLFVIELPANKHIVQVHTK